MHSAQVSITTISPRKVEGEVPKAMALRNALHSPRFQCRYYCMPLNQRKIRCNSLETLTSIVSLLDISALLYYIYIYASETESRRALIHLHRQYPLFNVVKDAGMVTGFTGRTLVPFTFYSTDC